jgi:hypothetical protein
MKVRPGLVVVLVAGVAAVFLVLRPSAPAGSPASLLHPAPITSPTAEPGQSGSPIAGVSPEAPAATGPHLTSYAVATADLAGLPPDAGPGTVLDLWVSWEPPLVEPSEVGVQSLLRGAILEKIVPPVTAQGPYVAKLLVSRAQVADLLNADRYGALSVTLPADEGQTESRPSR